MKKFFTYLLATTITLFSFTSCEELFDDVNTYYLTGTWYMASEYDNVVIDGYVTYSFYSDSTCEIEVEDYYSGSYSLNTYTYVLDEYDNTIYLYYKNSSVLYMMYTIDMLRYSEMRLIPEDSSFIYDSIYFVR